MRYFLLLFVTTIAQAHPLDLGFIQMKEVNGKIDVSLDLNPSLGAALLSHQVTELNAPLVESRYKEMFDKTLGTSPLKANGVVCAWSDTHAELLAQSVRLKAVATCPAAPELQWAFPFVHRPEMPRTFQVLVKSEFGGNEHVYTADIQHDAVTIARTSTEYGFGQFVVMGIEHIGATPGEWYGPTGFHLPDGIDHILFLLGLILAGGTLMQMVKTATGFTVGHSVTLALASLHVVTLPQRFVESAIALSIAYVAVETLLMKDPKDRWRIAAAFGLVHGFGFASAINELNLTGATMAKALVGFNVGVECGQVILVSIMAPIIAMARKKEWARKYAIPAAAAGIFFAGSYWFVVRAFF